MNYGDIFTIKEYGKYFLWAECYGANIIEIEDGLYQLVKNPDAKEPTIENVEEARASMYQLFVDPITCHIQRLNDEEQTAEIMTKIAELRVERTALMTDIRLWFPYPDELSAEVFENSIDNSYNSLVEDYSNAE